MGDFTTEAKGEGFKSLGDILSLLAAIAMFCGVGICSYGGFKSYAPGNITISENEYRRLNEEIDTNKKIGRYITQIDGPFTRKFDTATGESCILFAPQSYWSNPKVLAEACEDPNNPTQPKAGEKPLKPKTIIRPKPLPPTHR